MTTQDGKHTVYRLQGAGDEREGVEIPMRLKDINGDPVETAGGGLPYTEYSALISQSGSNNPTATELYNDTGLTFSYTRDISGAYSVTISSPITPAKVALFFTPSNGVIISGEVFSVTGIGIETRDSETGALADGFFNVTFSVRIYP